MINCLNNSTVDAKVLTATMSVTYNVISDALVTLGF